MTRIMRDSTSAADIPVKGTDLVAGYDNGAYQWDAASWARFPGIPHVGIDVFGTHPESAVLDVEPGDAAPATAVTWCRARWALIHAGKADDYPPLIYSNRSELTPIFNALNAAGFEIVTGFRLWIATLDGTKTVPDMTGVTAVQYAGTAITGGHYDESIVYDDRWHAPAPPAAQRGYVIRTSPAPLTVAEVTSTDGKTWHE